MRPLYLDHGVCVRWLAMGFSHAGWGGSCVPEGEPRISGI